MRLVGSAIITNIHPLIFNRLPDLEVILMAFGAPELAITSGHEGHDGDGVHMHGSCHYLVDQYGGKLRVFGEAIDVRIKTVGPSRWTALSNVVRLIYRPDYFDVVLELDPPHIHIEYDPK